MYIIQDKKVLAKDIFWMQVFAPDVVKHAQAGQFVMLRVHELGERIPLTIADIDRKQKTIGILFQVVGKTTALLSELEVGEAILDFAGPLGEATKITGLKNVIVVMGGIGTAIGYPLCRALKKQGTKITVIVGFKNADRMILRDELDEVADEIVFTTDDGSFGEKGFVTDSLHQLLSKPHEYEHVFAVGPILMMKAVSEVTRTFLIPTTVSLNPIMVDGTGMCGGCRVKVGEETKFACVHGPDFDGHLVDFDLLHQRNQMYRDQEAKDLQEVRGDQRE